MKLCKITACVRACVCASPDCVGDVADAEAAGRLRRLAAVAPPHVPLGLRHKLEGLSRHWRRRRLGQLHGVGLVHPAALAQASQIK